jgi:hypothetical protein
MESHPGVPSFALSLPGHPALPARPCAETQMALHYKGAARNAAQAIAGRNFA